MHSLFTLSVLALALSGCASNQLPNQTNLATNLGIERFGDLRRLRDTLIAAGFNCQDRAMSLNSAPIMVPASEFPSAKKLASEIVARESLTVRLWKFPESPTLEVWENGVKAREEDERLY